jgi:hypothetical protein
LIARIRARVSDRAADERRKGAGFLRRLFLLAFVKINRFAEIPESNYVLLMFFQGDAR